MNFYKDKKIVIFHLLHHILEYNVVEIKYLCQRQFPLQKPVKLQCTTSTRY